jgi:hypothetical protein
MAADAPNPGSRRSRRLRVIGRLTALVGVPGFILFTIFTSGVFFGASRSYRVLVLEAEYLGLEHPDAALAGAESGMEPATPGDSEQPPTEQAAPGEQPQPGEQTKPGEQQKPGEQPKPGEQTKPGEQPEQPQPNAQPGLPVAIADPVGPELRTPFEQRLVVRVKLMVDPSLVVAREDWLTYAASLIDTTRSSFAVLFGIEVQLQGIVIWDIANVSGGAEALLADLAGREREGADVILGLVAQPEPEDFEPKLWTDAEHGDHTLVYANLRQSDRYHRNLLRTLAGLLGAAPTTDSAAKQLGSFMSDAETAPGTPPVIDPDNRRLVITSKGRPFAHASPREGTGSGRGRSTETDREEI